MSTKELQQIIDAAWERRAEINTGTKGQVLDAVQAALDGLDRGEYRVAEKRDGKWETNQWLKKAVLLSFRLIDSELITGGGNYPGFGESGWYDKVPSKFAGWTDAKFRAAGFRAVPNCVVRRSAYVDSGTMVDTWVTIGSCAQIGKNCHISGGVGIGGVLEPVQAGPVVIEDNCFIGARSEVVEGVVVGEGSVISMGVFIGASTKIVDRATGEVHYGKVPPYSVVVSGALPGKPFPNNEPGPSLYCAVIVKRVDEKTRSKTSINDLLRD